MSGAVFVKRYDDSERYNAAAAHHAWLAGLGSGVRLPALVARGVRHLIFERLPGHTPEMGDLPRAAAALGRLHAAAHGHELRAARLDQPHITSTGLVIPDFTSPRQEALHRAAAAAGVPGSSIGAVLDRAGQPAAFYKDPNIRNYLANEEDVAVVDFDDMTLAPFGYDLAGLLVTASMTHGRLDEQTIAHCLHAYRVVIAPLLCSLADLKQYAELHHLLTLRYLGRNGYRHPWPTVRPWPDPFPAVPTREGAFGWPPQPNW
ncbi:phosphotransferase [Micromonospora tarensis]|uniref:Phosphotransferase n=1 Tax=Micromonospora tarensis TaxID=2806100 RepID=A0ABS1YJZ2_9ACTN|nr:phosphotransferase [Micromonospora tarensis]MBM0277471.1 phosphotransferase [Micromonospora tarensis]